MVLDGINITYTIVPSSKTYIEPDRIFSYIHNGNNPGNIFIYNFSERKKEPQL